MTVRALRSARRALNWATAEVARATGSSSHAVRAARACRATTVSALIALGAPALAAPVVYDITFTLTKGTSAPSGFFTHDATVGPGGTFSDFIVTHRGVAHDFTAKANAPTTGGCASGATGFDIMAGLTSCPSNQNWAFYDYEFTNPYSLFASTASLPADPEFMPWAGFLAVSSQIQNGDGPDDGGTFTIAARGRGLTVPEPMTLLIVGVSLAGLAAVRRRGSTPHSG